MSNEEIGLPPYEGGPLRNPGMPGRDPLFALGEHERDTDERTEDSPEMVHMPTEEQLTESIRNWKPTITFAPSPLTEERVREIFRDEMAKWEKSLTHRVRMNRPTR